MIDRFHDAKVIDGGSDLGKNRISHLQEACKHAQLDGYVLEFGVHKAETIQVIAECFPEDQVYGFDSFEGLPEDWNISHNEKFNKHKKGYFAIDIPSIDNPRIHFVKGFFDKMKSMNGVRLPGERRHKNRLDKGPRKINSDLIKKIKTLSV